jgi:beta-glucosidase
VAFELENTGRRRGSETVQLYMQPLQPRIPRPRRELKGFQKVSLGPGERRVVELRVPLDAFSVYDPGQRGWVREPGDYLIEIGQSSREIRLSSRIIVR